MSLTLEHVSRVVDHEVYIDDACLTFEPGSFNVLIGRTLSGKTSLMRLMAGLDKPTRGRLLMNGVDVTGVPVRKRNVSMVYQQFINYPTLTVFDNIASPLRQAGVAKGEIERKVRETAEMLHIEGFLGRYPLELSGGQQQRTALRIGEDVLVIRQHFALGRADQQVLAVEEGGDFALARPVEARRRAVGKAVIEAAVPGVADQRVMGTHRGGVGHGCLPYACLVLVLRSRRGVPGLDSLVQSCSMSTFSCVHTCSFPMVGQAG